LKFESLKVPAKVSGSPVKGKAMAIPVKQAVQSLRAPSSQKASLPLKQVIAGEERRRSYRVLLRVRASIHVALQGKPVTFETVTLSVSNHGALVVLKQNLPCETRLVLEHSGTKERVACKVARIAREMPEGFHVPLEFDSPAPNFWRIAFPPPDWRPPDDL
jgi:PilZ domain